MNRWLEGRWHTIESNVRLHRSIPEFPEATVKNEPMLFNCDADHADEFGGPITHAFLRELDGIDDWGEVPLVIDSRVHMLMPGWYPCIPGWHHDDVPRTRSDGQPNYGEGQCRSRHIFCLVNASVAPTEFALGKADFLEPDLNQVIYSEWHGKVEKHLGWSTLKRWSAPDRTLVEFDDRTWHRGVEASKNGWRFFIRASRYFSPEGEPIERGNRRTNEVRRQVQVYLKDVNAGW